MKKVNGILNKVLRKNELELETFELIDVLNSTYDEEVAEYKTKIAELGIDASQGIIQFPKLTRGEVNVWKAYCPTHVGLEEYTEVIPLEVVRLLEELKKRKMFHKVEIWKEAKEVIDPVVIGFENDNWSSPQYLLARWGLSLIPYDQIVKIAKENWKDDREIKLKDKIKTCSRHLEDLESDTAKHFNGESFSEYF